MPEFENQQGNYHTKRHNVQPIPDGASPHYPNYACANGCGFNVSPDSDVNKCPRCRVRLSRWVKYEIKGKPTGNAATPSQEPGAAI